MGSCYVITVLLLVDLPPECQTIALSSWDKRDLLTLWEVWSKNVDGPMRWPLSLNITHCVCRRIQPPNCGTASLQLHCVANERSFPSWFTRGVFTSNIACNQPLSSIKSTRVHLPSTDNGFGGGYKTLWLGMKCVCGGWGDKSTWLLSLLFSLKGF